MGCLLAASFRSDYRGAAVATWVEPCMTRMGTLPGVVLPESKPSWERQPISTVSSRSRPQGDVLVFSFIGFENKNYLVDAEKISVTLIWLTRRLKGGGYALGTQRKISVVGAITSVTWMSCKPLPRTSPICLVDVWPV